MKKFFAVLLTILGVLGLASCTSTKTSFKAKGKKVTDDDFAERLADAYISMSKNLGDYDKLPDVEIETYTKRKGTYTRNYDAGYKETSKYTEENSLTLKYDADSDLITIKGTGKSAEEYKTPSRTGKENSSSKRDTVYQDKGNGVAIVDKVTKTYSVSSSNMELTGYYEFSQYLNDITEVLGELVEFDEDYMTFYVSGDSVFTVVYEKDRSEEHTEVTVQLVLKDDEMSVIAEYKDSYTVDYDDYIFEGEYSKYTSTSIKFKKVSVKAVDLTKYTKISYNDENDYYDENNYYDYY